MKEEELEKYKKLHRDAFSVPDGYFASKKLELLAIPQESTSTPKVIPLWKQRWFTGSAVAAVLISGLFFLFQPITDPIQEEVIDLNDLTEDQIETYLMDEYFSGISGDHLMIDELDFTDMENNL